VKFLFHPPVETRICHTAKNRNCAVSLVRKKCEDARWLSKIVNRRIANTMSQKRRKQKLWSTKSIIKLMIEQQEP